MCKDFAPNFGNKRTGCCITTTHRLTLSFSPGNFFIKNNTTVIPHLPYFSLFPLLKIKLKDRHIDTIEVIETESQAVMNTLTEHDFQTHLKRMAKALGTVDTRGMRLLRV
jgi:hypothetical protein